MQFLELNVSAFAENLSRQTAFTTGKVFLDGKCIAEVGSYFKMPRFFGSKLFYKAEIETGQHILTIQQGPLRQDARRTFFVSKNKDTSILISYSFPIGLKISLY